MSNRLAAEKSPYLRQHANNPVAWFPWGEEALAKAQAEQKPIFLSIGYSTCHWCHVMAHESFENPAVAEVLNRDFVPVKVDREERPDLDRVYMTYVQQTTGHGGWPMSVWLTPEAKPFHGGTYFPPDDRHGRPGFVTVLNAITRHWQEQRQKIETGADEVVQALRRHATAPAPGERNETGGPAPLHEAAAEAFELGFRYFHETHDSEWGGFGGAPKFPRASVITFLFRSAALQGVQSELGAAAVHLATHTLQKMAEGGLHDHVGGGFHRYSVDEQWFVPHFEKMLYDQAQIALNYLEAKQATGQEVFAWMARGIFDYVERDLTGPHGGFYSAEDADSEESGTGLLTREAAGNMSRETHATKAEGAFYVWTKAEIDSVLGADAAFFCAHFGVKPDGNVTHDPQGEFPGKNVLMQRQSLVTTAREFGWEIGAASLKMLASLGKLQLVRAQRPRPQLDDKVITAWNGLMISALAKGAQVLGCRSLLAGDDENESPASRLLQKEMNTNGLGGEKENEERERLLGMATHAAEFIERELYDAATGTLFRSWREGRSTIGGFAEDYAYLIQGLLDLYEAGFAIRWLEWAERLQAKMDELFWDSENGGYFNSRADDPTVILRLKEDYDGAEPAPNSVAATNLLRLDWMLGGGTRAQEHEANIKKDASNADAGKTGRRSESGYRARALQILGVFRPHWSRAPQALPQMICALELALSEPRTVVLAGDPAAEDFRALAAALHGKLGLRRAVLCADAGEGQRWLAARRPDLAEMKPQSGRATAYVCENFTCLPPISSPGELSRVLGG